MIREGFLQRKNELDEGGRKAAARSWKNYYTVLIGPLLNFYKDKRDFQQVYCHSAKQIRILRLFNPWMHKSVTVL